MKALYIAWQDPDSRQWHTVGRLWREQEHYRFVYTQGALQSPRFGYLGRMNDLHQTYYSDSLFPLFANRLLDTSRPEYPDYLAWMGVEGDADELELLARSGGRRGTDQLCVYPEIEADDHGEMTLYFFSHGLRYLTEAGHKAIDRLQPGDGLQLTAEDDNQHDRYALLLETQEPMRVGYCPRYLNQDLMTIRNHTSLRLTVEKINRTAPLQFRLLCKARFALPAGFALYATDEHRPLAARVMAA
jgi:hypothetical protein